MITFVAVLVDELEHLAIRNLMKIIEKFIEIWKKNNSTFWTSDLVHLYWMYRSADASKAHTVSTLMQHWTKPTHARRSSSSP